MSQNIEQHDKVLAFFKKAILGLVALFVLVIVYYVISLYRVQEDDEPEAVNDMAFKFLNVKFTDNKQTLTKKGFSCNKDSCQKAFSNGMTTSVTLKDSQFNAVVFAISYKDLVSCNKSIAQMDAILVSTNSAEFENGKVQPQDKIDHSISKGVISEINENGKDVVNFNNDCVAQSDGTYTSTFRFNKQ